MALRILFLLLGATIAINLVLATVSFVTGVNLYEKYGKQILIFFGGVIVFVVASFIVISLLGLI